MTLGGAAATGTTLIAADQPHPFLAVAASGDGPQQQMIVHTHFHQPSVLVPPNPYLHEEIPPWLRVYWKASPTLDHHLKWDLFELAELECYDSMLVRLLKDGWKEIVMRWLGMVYRGVAVSLSYLLISAGTRL